MPWPLPQDYNETIQTPSLCFADPELKQAEPVTNAFGLPVPCSGNFGDVYALQSGSRNWAVKCFTRQIPGLRERYVQISRHLQKVQLPFMVEFQFLEPGIRVRGDWYPVLKMGWVEGYTLNTFVRNNLDKPQVLETLCHLWVKLAAQLREANLAHGDLQHGNVLLVSGSKVGKLGVRLVDYDGMFVPALEQMKPTEVGHPSYQHPQRLREGTYGLQIDAFAHLVIFTALRSLAAGGRRLWEKFDNGDNLLFTQKDFEKPDQASVFQELGRLKDPEVRILAQTLAKAAQGPISQVPLLLELDAATMPAPPGTYPWWATIRESKGGVAFPETETQARDPVHTLPLSTAVEGGVEDELATVNSAASPFQPGRIRSKRSPQSGRGMGLAASVSIILLGVLLLIGGFVFASTLRHSKPTKTGSETEARKAPTPPSSLPPQVDNGPPNLKVETDLPVGEFRQCKGKTGWTASRLFSQDGGRLLTFEGKFVVMWEVATGQEMRRFEGHTADVSCAAFSPDDRLVLSGSLDRTLRFWNTETGKEQQSFGPLHDVIGPAGIVLTPDERRVVFTTGGESTTVHLVDIPTRKELRRFSIRTGDAHAFPMAISGDGHFVLSVGYENVYRLWRVETGKELRRFDSPCHVYGAAFSRDGRRFLTCGADNLVRLWDFESGKELLKMTGHSAHVYRVAFSRDGQRALSGSADKTVRFWDLVNGKELFCFKGHSEPINQAVGLSPDGKHALSATDHGVQLWELPP